MKRLSREKLYLFLSILIIFATYFPTLTYDLVFDDIYLVQNNALIRDIDLNRIFTSSYWEGTQIGEGEKIKGQGIAYRPISILFLALNYKIGGLDPFYYHLINVILHCIACIFVYMLFVTITGEQMVSILGMLFFGIHPIQTEAVTPVFGRGETLKTIFVLGVLIVTIKEDRPVITRFLVTLILTTLAMFTKENAVIILPLALLFCCLDKTGFNWQRFLYCLDNRKYMFICICLSIMIYIFARKLILGSFFMHENISFLDNPLITSDFIERALTSVFLIFQYFSKFAYPISLSADYSYAEILPVTQVYDIRFIAGFIFIACILIVAVLLHSRKPIVVLGFLVFFISIIPVSNLFFPVGTIFAERLMYMPMVGLSLTFAHILFLIRSQLQIVRSYIDRLLIPGFFAVCALLTLMRNNDWKTNCGFFQVLVQTSCKSAKAHFGNGVCMCHAGNIDACVKEYEEAISIYPAYTHAYIQLAQTYERILQYDQAEKTFRRLLEIQPFERDAYYSYGMFLARQLRFSEAERVLELGLKLFPDDNEIQEKLRLVRQYLGKSQ